MTTQSVKLEDLPYLDDERPFDALRAIALLKSAIAALLVSSVNSTGRVEMDKRTVASFIDELRRIEEQVSIIYDEHREYSEAAVALKRVLEFAYDRELRHEAYSENRGV